MYLIVISLTVLSVMGRNQRVINREQLPVIFGFSWAMVISGSMEPIFSAGDMLIFRECENYSIGDIVIFKLNGSLITHRIIGSENGLFITKGDANNIPDSEKLPPENICGKLTAVLPVTGFIVRNLRTPIGIMLMVIAGILLVEWPYITKKKKGGSAVEKA